VEEAGNVTRSELVRQVAERTGISIALAGEVVGALFETIGDSLGRGEDVRLSGFGSFHLSERRAHETSHPRTGERIAVPATRSVAFSPGSRLTEVVRGKKA
jgi:DNA-binding protein HU-beta